MELGKFKRIDFDEGDEVPDWLRDDEPQTTTAKPALFGKSTSQVKDTDDYVGSAVKRSTRILSLHDKKPLEQTRQNTGAPTVSVHITLPQWHVPRVRVPWRKLRPWLIAAVIVVGLLLGGKMVQGRLSKPKPVEKTPVIAAVDLGYKPLVPQANSATNNQTQIPKPSYDEQRQFYTFNDIYKDAHITVNQQATPEKLRDSEAEVKKLASSLGMSETFTTTRGTVYIQTSKESGSQRMFLVNDKMLMFVQSTKTLPNADWASYIQNFN